DGSTVWHAGNDGSGSGLNADLLDGLSSASFSQLGTAIEKGEIANSGTLSFDWANSEVSDTLTIGASGSVNDSALSANVSLLGSAIEKGEIANSGILSFDWADSEVADNLTNTGTLDGFSATTASTISTIAARNSSGDINARLFRSEYDPTNATINFIMTQIDTVSNNYIRPSTPAQVRSALDVWVNTSGDTLTGTLTSRAIAMQGYNLTSAAKIGIGTASFPTDISVHFAPSSGDAIMRIHAPTGASNQAGFQLIVGGAGGSGANPFINFGNNGVAGETSIHQDTDDSLRIRTGAATDRYIVTSGGQHQLVNCASTCLLVGGGSGKIDAGTIDPVYTIGGNRYATYMAGMTGVKEETTGVFELGIMNYESRGRTYGQVIDFNNLEEGSDLWLFAQTVNVDGKAYVAEDGAVYRTTAEELFDNMTVLLTPGFDGRVWYEKDIENKRITILADKSGEVSYRLTAPRFDYQGWSNYYAGGGEHEGFNLDKLLK
ncbi:MAG: hypothetical protein KJI72_01570, partial [Patescibacteria group bacterium]|nr:hypothetical protein [Patescibacteria group bacterium]